MIQQEISGQVARVLATNRISTQGVTVDGRDVLLAGPAGSLQIAEPTQKLVAETYGVRTVSVRTLDVAPEASTKPAKTETQAKLNSLPPLDVVEFDPASAQLTARGRQVLDQVAPLLAAAGSSVEIQGHTDSQGNPDANLSLSYRRAIATKNYLVNKGIVPDRLATKGYGDTQPIAPNDTAAGRRKNRRITFVPKEKP
jgi:outer membrane protein OmpA-like peptidoglycan-associated protein